MAICRNKYKNVGSEEDKLLFKTCTESTEYLHLYFNELKEHLIRHKKYEELYNFCYSILRNIKNPAISRTTALKVISITLLLNPQNAELLISKEIITYAYKLLKRNEEGQNKKYFTYFGHSTEQEKNALVAEAKILFKSIEVIELQSNSKEEKYINSIFKKIQSNRIELPEKYGSSHSILLTGSIRTSTHIYEKSLLLYRTNVYSFHCEGSKFKKTKRDLLNLLEEEFVNHSKVDSVYSDHVRVLHEVKEKTVEFLENGEYDLYCRFVDEMQEEEELNIRYESYLLSCPGKVDQRNDQEKKTEYRAKDDELKKSLNDILLNNSISFEDGNVKNINLSQNSNSKKKGKNKNEQKSVLDMGTTNFEKTSQGDFTKVSLSSEKNYTPNTYEKTHKKGSILMEENEKKCDNVNEKDKNVDMTTLANMTTEKEGINNEFSKKKKSMPIFEQGKNKNDNKGDCILFPDKSNYSQEGEPAEVYTENVSLRRQQCSNKNVAFDLSQKGNVPKGISRNVHSKMYAIVFVCIGKGQTESYFEIAFSFSVSTVIKIFLKNVNAHFATSSMKENPPCDNFNDAENKIINEFNSLLKCSSREEGPIGEEEKSSTLKEFRNNKNDGNSTIWNCLIKKSNFYAIKEDFQNYKKFLREKEKEEKVEREETLGDILGMNKYIDLKRRKNKNKNRKMNHEELNYIIDKFTSNIRSNTNMRNKRHTDFKPTTGLSVQNCANDTTHNNVHTEIAEKDIGHMTRGNNDNVRINSFNKYFTVNDNIRHIQETILKSKTTLYSDVNLEVTMEQHYYGVNGLIKFFLKNKRIVNYYDVDIQISNKILFPLKFKFLPYEKMLCTNGTNCYEMAVKCLHMYKGFPLIKISYRMQDMFRKNIELRLPIPINKFMKSIKISKDVFDKFWNNENFNLYKKEKIITKDHTMDNDSIIADACLGEALSVCYVDDKIYLCGCYADNSNSLENYFVLVGIEVMKKKVKIICKSNNPTLSSAILFLIILILKKHPSR
ncbi:hypothetical protein, conserved [Plasmodium ovale wallikeri]|uniref:Clathrin adaptor domain-containing protein n=1 Tax=Plasmodium ovale wallikeri TaxID=864142 RepID=A0A1A9A2G7_PLAOA|nr:hypothetical protein, conserved [Plasmodium ovale wallikeri]